MTFLTVLTIATLTVAAASRIRRRGPSRWRDHARLGMAAAMVVAGLTHLARPDPFLQHLPDWVPGERPIVAVTGVIEVLLGLALVRPHRIRRRAGLALAAYLVAVFPANVYVAVADVDVDGQAGGTARWIRLPLQALFIAWAVWSTAERAAPADQLRDRRRQAAAVTAS